MLKKWLRIAITLSCLLLLTGCGKKIQIFEEKPVTSAVTVDSSSMERDKFYVKNGTKFSSVYLPKGNASKETRRLDKRRVLYFINDEPMVPVHYKGEILALKSAQTTLFKTGITLERYKDQGYSIGVYGGSVQADGYYHVSISKGTAVGSNAAKILAGSQVDEIRIVSVGGEPVKNMVDEDSGLILGLEKDKSYTVEFYVGTYYYTVALQADTHFLQAFEYYAYEGSNVKDTKLSYVSFSTPEDLKSGYYNVNGLGVFLYHAYVKGDVPEDESLNDSYYTSEQEQILQYTRQYNLSVPVETRDMLLTIKYGGITDELDTGYDVGSYLISPDGIMYELSNDTTNNEMNISLALAMPGNWTICVFPRSLVINGIETKSDVTQEEPVKEEKVFTISEGMEYQAFRTDITGSGDVAGTIIAEDGRTYVLETVYYKDEMKNEQRYLIYRFPYMNPGTYKVVIYHYKSETTVSNIEQYGYDPLTNEKVK